MISTLKSIAYGVAWGTWAFIRVLFDANFSRRMGEKGTFGNPGKEDDMM